MILGRTLPASRSQLAKAKARDFKYNCTDAVTALIEQARTSACTFFIYALMTPPAWWYE
jgi:hypothetical protein